ncbi:pirin family protein [Flavobacterium branchiophilum]|uniref:Pirin family protein n=1 Tax=Flavobacterium branchiophilum (strain FL-15) TaxID=1034807 RepID=G2Z7H4_FLABF|nr:pirin family protein [Flavobacterium branchiophilum]CCB69080.1 Pirin family protein [Flavobacterium branchiophilum FL-15]
MEKIVLHKSDSRGHADHGWLNAYHSFSFANWYNPERIHFGMLRVLNDDTVAAGMGFGTHPHDNMEIITIPLEGDLAHKDSMGNASTICQGDVQVMSAGTGIQHSEFNPNADRHTKLFQIWIFPKFQNVTPRYQQITLDVSKKHNNFYQILSPNPSDEGVWIHQDAWFHLSEFEAGFSSEYHLKLPENGVYVMVISGQIQVNSHVLHQRDALGIWDVASFNVKALESSAFLLIEVPM